MGALLARFGRVYHLHDLERAYMRELQYSPLVYWAGMKKALRPLFEAGGETLRALGVEVEGDPQTCHDLAVGVVAALAPDLGPENKDLAMQLEAYLARGRD
jgi:hypothetical protein